MPVDIWKHWSYRALAVWHGLPTRPSSLHRRQYALAVRHTGPIGLTTEVVFDSGGGGWVFDRLIEATILFDQNIRVSTYSGYEKLVFNSRTPEFDWRVVKLIGNHLHEADAAAGRRIARSTTNTGDDA